MPGCPLRNFESCPEHNKKGGCQFWLTYASSTGTTEANVSGCAMVLTPLLLLENANALGIVAGEVNKVGAEVSAGRVENIKENNATREQLVTLAKGSTVLVLPDHNTNTQLKSIGR